MKIKIQNKTIDVDVAISKDQQRRGLMFQKKPRGMAFFYPEGGINSFWMKDTPCKLVLLFCYQGRIVAKETGIPFSIKTIKPSTVSDLIIELPYDEYVHTFDVGMKVVLT